MNGSVSAVYREPFKLGSPEQVFFAPGISVADIVEQMDCLPSGFERTGRVFIDQSEVPRILWNAVKPKGGITLTFHALVQGGDDEGGGKAVFAVIAAIALTVFTAGIATGSLVPLLGSAFAKGTLGANALAAGVGIVGQLAISALTAPPSNDAIGGQSDAGRAGLEAASVKGNVLQANAPIPRVIGTRRIFPPFAFEPIIEMVGQDQIVEAAYCLAGPHKLRDIQLGERTIDINEDDTDLTIETREGAPGDTLLPMTQRQGRTTDLNLEMSAHGADEENSANWDGTTLPLWHGFNSRSNPDEVWLHMQINGLIKGTEDTAKLRIPIRIRMRRRGDTVWRYLPEIHYQHVTQRQTRVQIKFYFGSAFSSGLPQPAADAGFVEARKIVPAQDVLPLGVEWESDSYFSAGVGDDVYRSGTQNSTNVQNIVLSSANMVEVYLDENEWSQGVYDIEIKRGATFRASQFVSSSYELNGDVLDFFNFRATNVLPLSNDQLVDTLFIIRSVSIWNDYPINQSGLSLISLKATNRQVDQLSVQASGIVRDYGGYKSPTATPLIVSPLSSISSSAMDRSLDIACECSVVLPKNPIQDAILFEMGGIGGNGVSIRYVDGFLIFRAGKGNATIVETVGRTVVLKIAITSLPFDNEIHKIAWDVRVSPGRIRLWVDDVFISEENTINGVDLQDGVFAGGQNGGYLTFTTTVAGTASPVDWDDAGAGDLSFWYDGELLDTSAQGWNVLTASSNPGPHYRDITSGALNYDPLPEELLDDVAILKWRDACFRSDYTCDMIAEGQRVQELRNIIAACGFARPYQSEVWGVVRDYNRSSENPVQIFSPRNSRELNWRKAFPRLPTGFRVNYKNRDAEDAETQIIVYRAGSEGNATRLEQITYEGITRQKKAIERATFDLRQARLRSIIYSMVAPIESIVCRRGSMVGINHDILTAQYGSARIHSVAVSGGNINSIILDSMVQVYNETDMTLLADMLAVDDMLSVGLQTSVAIRQTDGAFTIHPISDATGETDELNFTTPIAYAETTGGPYDPVNVPVIDSGCLVVVGASGKEYKRLIVTEIQPQNEHTATLTMVDEAPELWN